MDTCPVVVVVWAVVVVVCPLLGTEKKKRTKRARARGDGDGGTRTRTAVSQQNTLAQGSPFRGLHGVTISHIISSDYHRFSSWRPAQKAQKQQEAPPQTRVHGEGKRETQKRQQHGSGPTQGAEERGKKREREREGHRTKKTPRMRVVPGCAGREGEEGTEHCAATAAPPSPQQPLSPPDNTICSSGAAPLPPSALCSSSPQQTALVAARPFPDGGDAAALSRGQRRAGTRTGPPDPPSSGQGSECMQVQWDPKGGELRRPTAKPWETVVEAGRCSDVQIV